MGYLCNVWKTAQTPIGRKFAQSGHPDQNGTVCVVVVFILSECQECRVTRLGECSPILGNCLCTLEMFFEHCRRDNCAAFSRVKFSIIFGGLHFGRFFHKLIWSPWCRNVRQNFDWGIIAWVERCGRRQEFDDILMKDILIIGHFDEQHFNEQHFEWNLKNKIWRTKFEWTAFWRMTFLQTKFWCNLDKWYFDNILTPIPSLPCGRQRRYQ
jgi:hypothetical protein